MLANINDDKGELSCIYMRSYDCISACTVHTPYKVHKLYTFNIPSVKKNLFAKISDSKKSSIVLCIPDQCRQCLWRNLHALQDCCSRPRAQPWLLFNNYTQIIGIRWWVCCFRQGSAPPWWNPVVLLGVDLWPAINFAGSWLCAHLHSSISESQIVCCFECAEHFAWSKNLLSNVIIYNDCDITIYNDWAFWLMIQIAWSLTIPQLLCLHTLYMYLDKNNKFWISRCCKTSENLYHFKLINCKHFYFCVSFASLKYNYYIILT